MDAEEKLVAAAERKDSGNAMFMAGRNSIAIKKYKESPLLWAWADL